MNVPNRSTLSRKVILWAAAALLIAASLLAAGQTSVSKPAYVPGQVIVKLKEQAGGSTFAPLGQTGDIVLLGLQIQHRLHDPAPVFRRFRGGPQPQDRLEGGSSLRRYYLLKTDRDVRRVCAELNKNPDVEYAQPNYIYERCAEPNDPDFPDQYAHQLIQMANAWDISTGSRDIVIAVLDTGVDINHPDLKDNIWVNKNEIPNNKLDDDNNGYIDDISGWNFEDDNNDVVPELSFFDIEGHGTNVSGVIAATGNNGVGVCGVNWQGSIMALRLSIFVTSAEVAEALDYAAANGARVANMSFGGDDLGHEGDPLVKTAIDNAFEKGVLLVASAGNDDATEPLYPAAYYNVMAVSSTNGEDQKTGHSNFGPWVDIAAPGTDIVTTDLGNGYIATAGTSFSGPYVAAVGALVLGHRPQLTNVEVRAVLENTTDPVAYGSVDPNEGYIGTGRVNAYRALLAADQRLPLGEIIQPMQQQVFAADGNDIPAVLFVHGDSYRLDYRGYDQNDWIPLSEGTSVTDPNGLVHLLFANPGPGAFELRLSVTTEGFTHRDRKVFGVELGSNQTSWPKPGGSEDPLTQQEFYLGSPLCLDLDGDGQNEIVEASANEDGGTITIWKDDGTPLPGWPQPLGFGLWEPITASGLAVGDIDGDGDYEIVVVDDYNVMVTALHVESGQKVKGDWPLSVGSWFAWIVGNPVLADLDGDGDSEIIVALDAEMSDTDGLFAVRGDGTFLWQRRYITGGPVSVADFDHDGDVEIALCGYGPGITRVHTFILDHQGQQIKRWLGGSRKGTAIADLDGDGTPELVSCTEDAVMAVHIDGSTVWTTKVAEPMGGAGGLSIGDLDADGFSEVYVTNEVEASGFVYALVYGFDHQGTELSAAGFPKAVMGDASSCTPLIGDIDGDGQKELVVAVAGAPVIAWEADGSVTPGFPMFGLLGDIKASPAIEDLDQDGDIELMVNGYDYKFHVIDLPGAYDAGLIDWGMVRRDAQNSGWTAAAPRIDVSSAPTQIQTGQRLELQLSASNPANLPLRWLVGTLPEGAYYDANNLTVFWEPLVHQAFENFTLSFTVTDGIRQDGHKVSVEVLSTAIYQASMDVDPSWTLGAEWAWGAPAYREGLRKNDPEVARTGQNVVGYSLRGNYRNGVAETRYATTPPINCRGFKNVTLSFWRWLGIEPLGDYACLQVSNDGVTWTDVWATDQAPIRDQGWQFVVYPIPASLGDDQPGVYFRWGLGPTDASIVNGGWNIDDVQVTGDPIQ
jgi:subtilisin family serine protease